VIATRPREVGTLELLRWVETDDAPLTLQQAHDLVDAGLLVMANRHSPAMVELVVRAVR
jgi:hypothetical protein